MTLGSTLIQRGPRHEVPHTHLHVPTCVHGRDGARSPWHGLPPEQSQASPE